MLRFMVYNNKTRPGMGYSNPVGDVLGFLFCLYLCDNLSRPRRRYMYTRPVVVAQPAPVPGVVYAQPDYAYAYAYAKAPEPAPLPALALEVPPPPKTEVVERV